MRRTVEVRVRVEVDDDAVSDGNIAFELEAIHLVRRVLQDYGWFVAADEADVVNE